MPLAGRQRIPQGCSLASKTTGSSHRCAPLQRGSPPARREAANQGAWAPMTTRKDDPAKPAAGGDTSSSRPHATLDLKATVVNPPGASKDDKTVAKDEKPAAASAEPPKTS